MDVAVRWAIHGTLIDLATAVVVTLARRRADEQPRVKGEVIGGLYGVDIDLATRSRT
jgi:hypothetical protein